MGGDPTSAYELTHQRVLAKQRAGGFIRLDAAEPELAEEGA